MSIVVNNNIASLNAQRNLSINTKSLSKSFERLSSGYRINSASDDAAGLSISEGLRSQIRGNDQAIKNIQDGSNMLQIAEGGLSVINDNLQRIRELSVQAANDTYGTAEKAAILSEIDQRLQDITRTAKTATFNGIQLLSAATSKTVLQVGAGSAASVNTLDLKAALPNATATSL
jgi:flagellin